MLTKSPRYKALHQMHRDMNKNMASSRAAKRRQVTYLNRNKINTYRLYVGGVATDTLKDMSNKEAKCTNIVCINNVANGTSKKLEQWKLEKILEVNNYE